MAKVNFKRVQSVDDLSNLDITDGNLIVTGDGNLFIDYNNQRIAVGGTPDIEMSDTSTNPVQNKVIKEYIDDLGDDLVNLTEQVNNKIIGNSNYIKFDDGTLICYGKTSTFNINSISEHQENITLAESYLTNDFIVNVSISSGGSGWANVICRGGATSENTIRLIAGNYISNSTAQNIALSYMTIGKWK